MDLELEYRQAFLYFIVLFIFYLVTGYLITFLFFWILSLAPLEELDPDEVEDEEELWPFFEETNIELDWYYFEINFFSAKKRHNDYSNWKYANSLKGYVKNEEFFKLEDIEMVRYKKKKDNIDLIFLDSILVEEEQ